MPNNYVGTGGSGVPEGGAMQDDILRMSDATKRAQLQATQQNLNAATGGDGQPTKRAHDLLAEVNAADAVKDVDPQDPAAKVAAIDKRAAQLEKEAKAIQDSGTGNFKAQQTYLRAAALLRQQARQVHADWMGAISEQHRLATQAQQQQATSQPGGQ